MKILVVEDDPDARKVLSLILKLDGFGAEVASSGPEAIQMLSEALPDLVLLDVMMPDMDGYEVCAWIRANPSTAHLPVVMLSGKADPESVARGLEVGANEYLAKPIRPSSLTKQLHAVIVRSAERAPVL